MAESARDAALIDALRKGTLTSSSPWYAAAQAALKARQDAASATRWNGAGQLVQGPGQAAGAAPSTSTFGANTAADPGLAIKAAADAAAAAATSAANNSARSSANTNKTSLQQAIDAAFAQQSTNQTKLDALTELTNTSLAKARDTKLSGVTSDLKTLLDAALANYDATLGDLNVGLRGNEKAEADSTFANLANRAREKQDIVGQALSQGAGESDVLRSQLQALRNWDSNQNDINRSYFDTLASANSSITDLNIGTKSNMTGYEMDANQRQSSVWDDFYGAMSDAFTQKDNLASNNYLLGQEITANQKNMAGQDALLAWLNTGKSATDYVAATDATGQPQAGTPYVGFAKEAADYAGRSWENPGVSDATKGFTGQEAKTSVLNNSQPWGSQTNTADKGPAAKKKPEGATLRRW